MRFTRKLFLVSVFFICFFTVTINAFAANPTCDGIIPSAGDSKPGEEVLFTTTFSDPDGAQDLAYVVLRVQPTIDTETTRNIWCLYRPDKNFLALYDHDARKYIYRFPPESDNISENEYVAFNYTNSVASPEGNTLTVTFALSFKATCAGETYKTRLQVKDFSGAKANLIAGAWSVKEGIPRTLRFQGMLKDAQGSIDGNVAAVTFKLYEESSEGTAVWEETQLDVLIENGVLDVELGNITPFGALLFDRPYWLGVQIDPDIDEMTPRFKLSSVPYALGTE